jgi:tetratricopeptide (TPR) repeat protein
VDHALAGTLIGAYRLLHPIGRGGTGEVWLAEDPRLHRKVAIKLLQPHAHDRGRARLLREARAIAQITHPNVVAIYDVGTFASDDHGHPTRSFIAMEHVDGCSLAEWLFTCPRSSKEILATFLAAGRGLEAAHRAGQIHRDFKPANVMVGVRGGIKVLDFGIAKNEGTTTGAPSLPRSDAADERLTETGVAMGTPRYMSPEQHVGAAVGPASDQFSFCCALLEALQRAPAFSGHDHKQLGRAKLRGDIDWGPQPVAPRLRALLERGLERDPQGRFPSMTALLHALSSDRSALPRVVDLAALVLLSFLAATEDPTIVTPGEATTAVAVSAFDVARLHARIELAAGRALLSRAQATLAADRLEHALAIAETTDDEQLAAEIAAVLVGAAVLQPAELEHLPAIIGRADAAIRRAGEPATARGDWWGALSTLHTKRGEFAKSLDAADRAHAAYARAVPRDDRKVDGAAFNVAIALLNLHRFDPAIHQLTAVVAFRERSRGRTDPATIAALAILGIAHLRAGLLESAEDRLRDALARAESTMGDRHPELPFVLGALADVAARREEYELARTLYRRALLLAERREGPRGPEVASLAGRLGEVEQRTGHLDDARVHLAQALAGHEHMLGRQHAVVAEAYRALAVVELRADDPAGARGHAREAIAILESLDANPEQLARARAPLDEALRALGK